MNKEPQTSIYSREDAELAARFLADFLWGAATSAYQIEGAAAADGRAPQSGIASRPRRVKPSRARPARSPMITII
ncbi:hypothetical protein KDW_57150 [Dictyobacter vulcani]|uniref:Uncharacterized protein n=1 Tax=Dictyobacter vulcani TaxID=2607529 RepID=A0A5J4KVC1_9CHLR|nr:family 1 glycosylhydrolase [Dictyobacter vulcani]GER91553.1 hypothetical protein KDW_57150 [Dictyobacter vulcani]